MGVDEESLQIIDDIDIEVVIMENCSEALLYGSYLPVITALMVFICNLHFIYLFIFKVIIALMVFVIYIISYI